MEGPVSWVTQAKAKELIHQTDFACRDRLRVEEKAAASTLVHN
jgi:hypothetical protein